ncbi:MAG: phospholipase A [Burkholderiales bacterium]
MRTRLHALIMVLMLALTAGAAHAQTLASAIADCAAIAADSQRLACYDRASGRSAVAAPAAGKPAAVAAQPSAPAQSGVFPSITADPPVAGTQAAAPKRGTGSLIDTAWGFDPDSSRYIIDSYNQNYLLFARQTSRVNNAPFVPYFAALGEPIPDGDKTEAKFQISAKARVWTTDDRQWGVWLAYTQQSQWQLYNSDISKPFRDNNYMPEAFVSYRPDIEIGGMHWRLLNAGYNHQSNGRADLLSRSWDRVFVEAGVERGNFALLAKAWYAFNLDDNPNITDYLGHGSLTGIYKWEGHSFNLMARGNLNHGKGAAQFSWTSPKLFGPFRAYVQGFAGYGESLIDYNWNQKTIGIGVSINDAL